MASRRRRISFIGGLAAVACLVLPASASAAVTCNFDTGTGALTVAVTNGTAGVSIGPAAGPSTDVLVDDNLNLSSPIACAGGTPTTTTTSSITVDETGSTQGTALELELQNGRLEPGLGAETGTGEIEVSYVTDAVGNDSLSVDADVETADQSFRFGAVGAAQEGNLNGDDDVNDVTATGIDSTFINPGGGNDTITMDGSGFPDFTGPAGGVLSVVGSNGIDTVRSGSGSQSDFTGGPGNDTMIGAGGVDRFHMEEGNDTFDGGGGSLDTASYENHASATGVTLDLGQTSPQDTGDLGIDQVTNVEWAVGSNGGDHLTGTEGNNTLFGGNGTNDIGNDVLSGLGGNDQLIARAGDDVLVGGQGNDTLIGEVGTDTGSFAVGSAGAVTFSLNPALTGMGQITGGAGTDTLADSTLAGDPDSNHEVENLIGSPFGGDTLTGNANANQIDVYDGFGDTADCVGPAGGNIGIGDEFGVDTITNCDSVDNAPQTAIDSGPADGTTIATRTPSYNLSADEPSDFQVSVDSGNFQACSASCTVPSLSDGTHAIAFRAVDQDENGHADLTPATRAVTVSVPVSAPTPTPADATAPETSIGSHPKAKSRRRTATFTFTSSEPGSTFLCGFDGRPFTPCAGSFTTPKLKVGKHRFDVLSTDAAGNRDQSAATFRWKVLRRR